MLIAIHKKEGSFSDRWIEYCEKNEIDFKIVNCYSSNIIEQLKGCDGLMWHWSHTDYRDQNFARQLIFSIEKMGIKVFPSYNTCWHFDDKIGQKYLLEALGAPLVPTHVFYDKKTAYNWIEKITFPKVFKLRAGASSRNVALVKSKHKARKLIRKSFKNGFPSISRFSNFRNKLWQLKRDRNFDSIIKLINGFIRIIFPKKKQNLLGKEKGYVLFQEFIPNNKFDDRIIVIGNRIIAVRRYVRNNDFRASGSGVKDYDKDLFNHKSLDLAFKISRLLHTQSIAFDFVYDAEKNPLIVEISYAFVIGAFYDDCPGFWDEKLNWHKETVNPQSFIIEDFINYILKY